MLESTDESLIRSIVATGVQRQELLLPRLQLDGTGAREELVMDDGADDDGAALGGTRADATTMPLGGLG